MLKKVFDDENAYNKLIFCLKCVKSVLTNRQSIKKAMCFSVKDEKIFSFRFAFQGKLLNFQTPCFLANLQLNHF